MDKKAARLRRATRARKQIKEAYGFIYNSDLNRSQAVLQIQKEFKDVPVINSIVDFIENSSRGLI